ncbi:cell surface protein [Roseiconus nitratireducens]|uniref:Cell surface protein n=1 Tax=Roseiconus nitratireducens TaxID=2605748 RepID=A0A5M6D364_9BACT|nr:cell surface protein [Roseiconus nitratireducens]KAA5541030.1 cell surface protein [Roseiconus nitratireducens]
MSEQAQATAPPSTRVQERDTSKMRKYLDSAVDVLKKFGVDSKDAAPQELISLLESVKHIDEAKVLAIADVIQHMGAFNALVRENVESIEVGNRYLDIAQQFDSVREDSKRLIAQLDDGKISGTEKLSNWWMKMRRGTPNDRFEKIVEIYGDVAKDTKQALRSEETIMDAYIDFRFALKEAEVLSRELLDEHAPTLEAAKKNLADSQTALDNYTGTDEGGKSQLELARDEARHAFEKEDETYQLLKDIAENLEIGYDVGETLITKLKQTHDVKERVYRRAVTFFTTNEHVFTILGTVYQSQHGLHEVTQATEAMKDGVNKGLEDVADLGRELERAALRAGYGSTINPESVQKLVDAISSFQIESLEMIAELRKESEESTKAIRKTVEEGKRKYQETLARHARATS